MSPNNLPHLQRFIEFINSGDATIGQEVISDSANFHVPFGPPLQGLEGYLQILGMMRGAFPDINWTLKETVAEGDKVVARFETCGTHQAPFMGFPASGKVFNMTAVNIYRFENGRSWRSWDSRISLD